MPLLASPMSRFVLLTTFSMGKVLSAPFQQLGTAYVAATSASVLTALGFNKAIASVPALAGGVVGTS